MAEFNTYTRIAEEVMAIQWDGQNDTYEAISAELPGLFSYERPANILTERGSSSCKRGKIEIGSWIVIADNPKRHKIYTNPEFVACYEEKIIATSVNTLDILNV